MTRQECSAPVFGVQPTQDQPPRVGSCRAVACSIIRLGMRLMVCLGLLCAVAACGSQRDRTAGTEAADLALAHAMTLENVPPSWNDSLRFIMGKESGGRIGVQNPSSSARGLFQLTAANHHLNPNGAGSFGNGVEEVQGGIRYIRQRYGSADQAVEHWQQYHWY